MASQPRAKPELEDLDSHSEAGQSTAAKRPMTQTAPVAGSQAQAQMMRYFPTATDVPRRADGP
eukprot:3940998-Rhodomonas_salina.5